MGWEKSALASTGLTMPAFGIGGMDLMGGAGGSEVEMLWVCCWNWEA